MRSLPKLLPVFLLTSLIAGAQSPPSRALTDEDYQHAEKFLPYNTAPLVSGMIGRVTWLSDGRFWYREQDARYVLYDPATRMGQSLFDPVKISSALSAASGKTVDPAHLGMSHFSVSADAGNILFDAQGKTWTCEREGAHCSPSGKNASVKESLSPDKKSAAFIRDYNLWVRDVATGKEKQLTTDGVKDFGYATDNAGWSTSDRPIVEWSPDSRKIATFQQDQRGVGEMYLVSTRVGHPELRAWKYPLPGDDVVTTIQRVVIDLDRARVIRFKMPADQHRSTLCDDIACRGGEWADVEWSPDASHVAFVSTSRDHKQEQFRIADAATGDVRDVFGESVPTFYESGNGRVNWRYLPESHEAIWFSERSNWGHLYLYDLETGKMKQAITSGGWNVTQLLCVDEKKRVLYFLGVGREPGRDPYFIHFYRINFDGTQLTLLTPENADHDVMLPSSGEYYIDTYSKPDAAPVSLLRNLDGRVLATVAKGDISKLVAEGWKPPVPFTVKARDGITDLYGLLYKPTNFDPARKYPIIDHIYPGPQTGSVGGRYFVPSRGDTQALAELGFVVVEIDGMGTPWRSKKFHEAYYGNMGDNTLPDQVSGMQQLAQRYPWIDISRAGIYGHSGGGDATADAMFRYPDFFKVGIAEAGNHDNREYEDDWAEKWQGLLRHNPDGSTNYDNQANENIARNLKGHLLLAHGTMDNNVPPYNTLLVVDELIKANKDFDLILLPNRNHGFGSEPYMVRRRWDYFVRYLLGAEPPHEYKMHPPADDANGRGTQD